MVPSPTDAGSSPPRTEAGLVDAPRAPVRSKRAMAAGPPAETGAPVADDGATREHAAGEGGSRPDKLLLIVKAKARGPE